MSLLLSQLSGGTNYTKSLSDSVTLSDAVVKNIVLSNVDVVFLSDEIVKSIGLNKADTITISDIISKPIGLSIEDAISLSDMLSTEEGNYLFLSDSISITDNLLKEIGISFEDEVIFTDDITTDFTVVTSYGGSGGYYISDEENEKRITIEKENQEWMLFIKIYVEQCQ